MTMTAKKQTAAKQKAVEIVEKYEEYVSYETSEPFNNAKQCALIDINNTISALSREEYGNQHLIKEYQQVRSEIEKL